MTDLFETKPKQVPITKQMVRDAYRKVKSNKGSAGVHGQNFIRFDENLPVQPVQDLEPDVGRQFLSPTRQGGDYSQGKRGRTEAGRTHHWRQDSAAGFAHVGVPNST